MKTPSPPAPALRLWSMCCLAGSAVPVWAGPMAFPGATVYMTSLGLFAYEYVYLPLVLFLVAGLYFLLLRRLPSRGLRWALVALLLGVLVSLPWWDVYRIGRQVTRLCREEGGLHVYRTVEAEGFYGGSSIKYWSGYGFRFVESGKTKNGVSHWTLVDGEVRHRYVPEPTARYQWKGLENNVPVTPYLSRSSSHVVDRRTGEELGRLVWFTIDPGRFDRLVLSVMPVEHNPWICGDRIDPSKPRYNNHYTYSDLVKATIKPAGMTKERQ